MPRKYARITLGTVARNYGKIGELRGKAQAPEALSLLDDAAERAARGNRGLNSTVSAYLGEAYLYTGRPDKAREVVERTLSQCQERGERGIETWLLAILGAIYAHGDPPAGEEAEAAYRQALTLAEALGMRPRQAHCHRSLGTLYARTGQWAQAQAELSRAIAMYRTLDMTFWLPQTEAVLAEVPQGYQGWHSKRSPQGRFSLLHRRLSPCSYAPTLCRNG
jgi:tetratricopeptide (TPR) repeat protein